MNRRWFWLAWFFTLATVDVAVAIGHVRVGRDSLAGLFFVIAAVMLMAFYDTATKP